MDATTQSNYKDVSKIIFDSMKEVQEDKMPLKKAIVLIKQGSLINNIHRTQLIASECLSKKDTTSFYKD